VTAASRPPILATRRFDPDVIARLRAGFAVTAHDDDAPMGRDRLLGAVSGMHGLMVTPGDRVDDELLDAAGPDLRVVATLSVGLDHIDLGAAARHGVRVGYTPDVLTRATAELAIAAMLALLRRVVEGDRMIRSGVPWRLAPEFMLGRSPAGLRFGCIGYGRIGREASRLAGVLGMEPVHCGRVPTGAPGDVGFGELVATSEVVSIHAPLSAETRHLIDAEVLARMRPDAVLVNTSRGPLIDEDALVTALQDGVIAGAALDVFEHEPEVHPGLLPLENVVLVPHLGSATRATRRAMGMCCADVLETVLLERGNPTNFAAAPPG
jgi:glyoxylate reductase